MMRDFEQYTKKIFQTLKQAFLGVALAMEWSQNKQPNYQLNDILFLWMIA